MGFRGPPKKPTALRMLEGNPSGRPINPSEPKPKLIEKIEPPKDLPEEGKLIWKSLSEEMIRIGLLSEIDLHAFHRYIKYLLEYYEADRLVAGKLIISMGQKFLGKDENGKPIMSPHTYVTSNPYLTVRNQAANHLNRLEQQLGLTPAARARMIGLISGKGGPDDEDPYGA